ncbi:MAG: tetratricopeptide repeat protein [Planctomycetota bacterium]
MSTSTRSTVRAGLAAASILALAGAAILPGCGMGGGSSTSEHANVAKERMNQLKSATEWDLAQQAFLAGDLDKAIEKVDTSLKLNPQVAKSHVLRGRILLEQGAMGEALDSLETAEAIDPTNIDARYFQGIIYERLTDRENALVQYQAVAELDQSNAQYVIAVAEVMVDLGRVEEADEYLEGLGSRFEHSPGVRQTQGYLAFMLDRPESAYEHFRDARLLAPDDQAIAEDLVRAQISTGRFAEAEYNLALLLSDEFNADRRDLKHLRSRCLLSVDRPMEARELLLDLTSGDEGASDVGAWIGLGQVAYRLQDMARVRRSAARLQAIAPQRHEGFLYSALWQRDQGRFADAVKSTTEALKRKPDDFSSLTLRGLALVDLNKLEHARKTFEYTKTRYPKSETIARALAAVELRQQEENAGFASANVPEEGEAN